MAYAPLDLANLFGTKLSDAYLRNADLTEASLVGANLSRAKMHQVSLDWTSFVDADLSGVNLHRAKYNTDTFWPEDGFDPIARGATLLTMDYDAGRAED